MKGLYKFSGVNKLKLRRHIIKTYVKPEAITHFFGSHWTTVTVGGKTYTGIVNGNHQIYSVEAIEKYLKENNLAVKFCCNCLETFYKDGPLCSADGGIKEVSSYFYCDDWKPVTVWHRIRRRLLALFSVCEKGKDCNSKIRCRGCKN